MQNLKLYAILDRRTNEIIRGPKQLWYETESSVKQAIVYKKRMTVEDRSYLVPVEIDLSNSVVRVI